MRRSVLMAAGVLVLGSAAYSSAAEKIDIPATRAAVDQTAAKVGNYPQALAEIEKARLFIKKAEQAYENGKQWMGLRGLKPEAEQEVLHQLQMVDLSLTLAASRAAKGRNDDEVAAVDKQINLVKGRVKLLEERKQADDKMRQDLQKSEAAVKELAAVKAEQAKLVGQLEQAGVEKKKLEMQVTALTAEKDALTAQLAELKKAAAAPAPPAVPAPPAAK